MTMIERSMQINPLDAAAALSDRELLQHVKRLAGNERHATAHLVAHLAEVDARRLYLGEGYSSLFTYCAQVLHLSEHAAYGRIEAARAARRFPALLDAIASGAVHLTAVTLIAPHLTPENVQRVIAAATHKTKRDVEELVAALRLNRRSWHPFARYRSAASVRRHAVRMRCRPSSRSMNVRQARRALFERQLRRTAAGPCCRGGLHGQSI